MQKVINWFKGLRQHFVEDARCWYKMWSTWLAVIWGALVAAIWENPATVAELYSYIPAQFKTGPYAVIVGGVIGALPVIVRLLKQGKISAGK